MTARSWSIVCLVPALGCGLLDWRAAAVFFDVAAFVFLIVSETT